MRRRLKVTAEVIRLLTAAESAMVIGGAPRTTITESCGECPTDRSTMKDCPR